LYRVERGKHPFDRARSGIRIAWKQARMALRDMQHNRSGFEESEIAFLIGWNLSERMKRQMRGFLHLFERQKTNVVSLAHFFERPTNAHVPRQSPATIGRLLKGGDGGVHRSLRALSCTYYRVCVSRR